MREKRDVWGLRALSVAIAVALWFFVSLDRQTEAPVEKLIEADVVYPTLDGLVVMNPVDKVRVRVLGRPADLNALNPFTVDVQVELPRRAGVVDIPLGAENVRLATDVEVVAIEPAVLHLEIDREIQRLVAVRVQLVGEPAAGAVALQPVVRPAEIPVRGPERALESLDFLSTSPVPLDGHALTFEQSAIVLTEDPMVKVVGSSVVRIQVPMEQPELPSR